MATQIKQTNGLWSWQGSDFFKGLIMTVLTTALTGLYTLISAGTITWELFKPYFISSLGAGVAYLLKNFASNNRGEILQKDKPVTDAGLYNPTPPPQAPR